MFKSLYICFSIVLVSAVAAWAGSQATGPARIQGIVQDSKGNPVAGAEVHLTAKDGSGLQKIIRTDASGNYGVSNLPTTDYEVVLFVNGQIKASLTNQKVFVNKPTKVDFKLTGKYVANNTQTKRTHMVYVPAETGSNLGGHWVEVDDTSGAGTAGTDNVRTLSGAAVRQMQNHGNSGGGN